MNIEFVEFYQLERNDQRQALKGTLHVYLCDLDIDLRGVFVLRNKDFGRFSLPFKKALDENGDLISYPVFNFVSIEKQRALIEAIIEKGKEYVLSWMQKSR